jgi:hypothetical protein
MGPETVKEHDINAKDRWLISVAHIRNLGYLDAGFPFTDTACDTAVRRKAQVTSGIPR